MRNVLRTTLVLSALIAAGCQDTRSPTEITSPPVAAPDIMDAEHSKGTEQFYFLPPMVPNPGYSGTFDAGLAPEVVVLDCGTDSECTAPADEPHVEFSNSTVPVVLDETTEKYTVNWHTRKTGAVAGRFYRIIVRIGDLEIGWADAAVARNGRAARNMDGSDITLINGQTLPINFRVETGLAATVTVSPATASVFEESTQAFNATVLDLHGDPLAGVTVDWAGSSSGSGSATLSPASGATDAEGKSSSMVTGIDAGTVTITATSGPAVGSGELTVVATPSLEKTTITADPTEIDADGESSSTITVQLKDADGDDITVSGGTLTLSTTAGELSDVTYEDDGTYTGTLTAPTTSGDATISGTLNDEDLSGEATVTLKDISAAPAAANIEIRVGDNQSATVGTKVGTDPEVRVTAADGSPVSGVSVTFEPGTSNGQGGSVSGSPVVTDADGIATVEWTLATMAGSNVLTASADGLPMDGDQVQFSAEGEPDQPTKYIFLNILEETIEDSETEQPSGSTRTYYAALADEYDNRVTDVDAHPDISGRVVEWTNSSNDINITGSFSEPFGTTNGEGTVGFEFKTNGNPGTIYTIVVADPLLARGSLTIEETTCTLDCGGGPLR